MSDHKHTPGPWEVYLTGDSVCIKKGKKKLPPLSIYLSIFERKANAQLIAAAPEMLEALETVWSVIEDAQGPTRNSSNELVSWEEIAKSVQNAIAKATGKEAQNETDCF